LTKNHICDCPAEILLLKRGRKKSREGGRKERRNEEREGGSKEGKEEGNDIWRGGWR
jgi:hypothetical protein